MTDKKIPFTRIPKLHPSRIIPPETLPNDSVPEIHAASHRRGFLNGHDANLVAYGQTGSGKTHTMFGPPGILHRAAEGRRRLLRGLRTVPTGGIIEIYQRGWKSGGNAIPPGACPTSSPPVPSNCPLWGTWI